MTGVIYARYSSDNQREESIEGQIRDCKTFAEKNDIQILGTYIDRALSAKSDNRPEFQRMIKESARKSYDVVIVWKLDRFARNRYDAAYYKNVLKKNKVKVISAMEPISDTPEGILMEAMLEGYAEYYSAELAQKVTRGMTGNALKCRYNGGTLPIGYVIDKEQRQRLVDHFVNVIYLYDDHFDLFLNFREGAVNITFDEDMLKASKSKKRKKADTNSDLTPPGNFAPPEGCPV